MKRQIENELFIASSGGNCGNDPVLDFGGEVGD